MKKDIVERLRASAPKMVGGASAHCNDIEAIHLAADEIERLRAALAQLALLGERGIRPDYKEWLTFHDKVAKVARDALAANGQSAD